MSDNEGARKRRVFGAKTPASPKADPATIKELAALLDETGLSEIEIEQGGSRVRVARYGGGHMVPVQTVAPQAATVAPPVADPGAKPTGPHPGTLTSPMVGTAYLSPQPGAAAFVKQGDTVKEGQTLLIIEAMKTMNPIAAPKAGTIVEIMVRDSQPVEFGEPLLVIG